MISPDEDLKRLSKALNEIDHPVVYRLVQAILARMEAGERCIEATRKWLVNQGPQEDIDLTMIEWRKAAGKL